MPTLLRQSFQMTKEHLLRRAQLVARLHHPNLAQMLPLPFGAGLTPITNGARTLADFSAPDGAFGGLQLEQIIWLLLDVLSGLRALHELEVDGAGFVHGAISPQYILLGEPGEARLVPVTSAHLNVARARETSGYAAPEVLLGEAADLRADLFSVGVLLWEAVAQQRLFPDGSRDAVVTRLAQPDAPALGELVSARWAMPLCQIVERAIAVDPSARFGSALDLSRAIVAAVGPRLTSPQRAAFWPQSDAPVPAPAPTPRTARWRTATPLSVVIDLAPPPSQAEEASARELDAGHLPAQPALSSPWRRWQPVLAGLAAVILACAAWRMTPHRVPHAAVQQPLAVLPAPPARPPAPSTRQAVLPSTPPPPASVKPAESVERPFALRPAAPFASSAVPRKLRAKLPSADSDYGI